MVRTGRIEIEVKVIGTVDVEDGGVIANGGNVTGDASVVARVMSFDVIDVQNAGA